MKNTFNDAYNRILAIYSQFQLDAYNLGKIEDSKEYDKALVSEDRLSVRRLSEIFQVSQETICKDLRNMCDTKEIQFDFSTINLENDTDKYKEEILKGLHPDEKLMGYVSETSDFFVGLNPLEKYILSNYQNNGGFLDIVPDDPHIYFKKQREPDRHVLLHVQKLKKLASSGTLVDLIFEKSGTKTVYKDLLPVCDITYNLKGDYYFVFITCSNKGQYNHQFIKLESNMKIGAKRGKTLRGKKVEDEKKKIDEELEYRWGVSEDDNKPFTFKMKVFHDGSDIVERLEKLLSHRKYGNWIKCDNGEYEIYTDTVIGYKPLKEWAMSFGSSVVVLEPKEIGEEIYELAKKRAEIYNIIYPDDEEKRDEMMELKAANQKVETH